ncbi:arginine N-succinyltransferase [Vulgatibacter incomptus]|uniref:Arginine N-succinyltransferase n=1 Tax=Vulgatibacter incomptus TaxID=1391653 RepID=A0A0K1PGR6_9BACT|nr:arginine N-succinyltransferase [Vulgatibacter incomptus]AKU92309.1 Arginine N-succinyltransferase [Vulgatibacter incomptus]
MHLLRDVAPSDLPGLKRLAEVLNTVNLPNDEEALQSIIDKSVRSFGGRIRDPLQREYLFVLEETRTGRLVGTSMVIAQHGTFEAPHVFFEVSQRQSYSSTIERHFQHTVLSIAYHYEGPTEIGGLVVDPELRGQNKPGKQLSYVRFLFIGMHRPWFRDHVLAELLPPLLPDGRSLLWETLGKKFTGLSYMEADRLSRQNKEFIKELFPQSDIYATLFPERVQKVIGRVGPNTEGVKKMLERIGFRYMERIDPFDGGPHFEARTSDVSLIRSLRRCKVLDEDLLREDDHECVLVAAEHKDPNNRFRAVKSPARVEGDQICLPGWARDLLGVSAGDKVASIPFE